MTPAQNRLRVVWHWSTLGPYHFARMEAIAKYVDLFVVETTSCDDHEWRRQQQDDAQFRVKTLSCEPETVVSPVAVAKGVAAVCRHTTPDVIVVAGYRRYSSWLPAISYRFGRPGAAVVLWSESQDVDRRRWRPAEAVKRFLLKSFDGAIVAGTPHLEYLRTLGMPGESVAVVGNVVNNRFFTERVRRFRAGELTSPPEASGRYFLYVGRFIPEKNLLALVDAYATYRQRSCGCPWRLIFVGSGPLENAIRRRIATARIPDVVLTGPLQASELCGYYAHAGCLVLPSVSEPWGLVSNEAIAAGVPVLASERCGCVPDLLRKGQTALLFSPENPGDLVAGMLEVSSPTFDREGYTARAAAALGTFSPEAYAARVVAHLTYLWARRREMNDRLRFINQGIDRSVVDRQLK